MQPRIHHEERRTRREGQVIFDRLSNSVIGCAIEVHRELGPGLLESAYEQCMATELSRSQIRFDCRWIYRFATRVHGSIAVIGLIC